MQFLWVDTYYYKNHLYLCDNMNSKELFTTIQNQTIFDNESIDKLVCKILSGTTRLIDSQGDIYHAPEGSIGIAAAIISQRDTTDGGRVLRDIEELVSDFREYGQKHNCWFTEEEIAFGKQQFKSGSESEIYCDCDGNIFKLTSARDKYADATPFDIVDGIAHFNQCFPETSYEMIGFGTKKDGTFCFITKQILVQGHTISWIAKKEHNGDEKWAISECERIMIDLGFIKNNLVWMSPDGKYIINDICGEYVMLSNDGQTGFIIDADVYNANSVADNRIEVEDITQA